MTSFRAVAGSGDDWPSACNACLAALGAVPSAMNLGIVYASGPFAHAIDLIAARMKEATGIRDWVGTGGNGVCTSAPAIASDAAIAVLVAALPVDGYRLFDGLGDETAGAAGSALDGVAPRFALVHGDPRQARTPSLIERLGETTGAFLVGGLTAASGDGAMQIAGRPTEGGLSGVMIGEAVPVVTGLTQGCTPIGPVREVTALDGPWITALDGGRALDALQEDVGPLLARNIERIRGFILAARPEGEAGRNDYLVRDLGEVDPIRGGIMVGDDFRRGDGLCFVKRDPEAARADLRRLAADLGRRAEGRPLLGGLYHSCIGRGRHLFGDDYAETAIIEAELGALPLSGFSTQGEIFGNRLYGYSAVLTLFLGERP